MPSPTLDFVDAHHHLWDLAACQYPWLQARGIRRFFGDPTPIQKNYLPQDFLTESARYRPRKSVHIQVGVASGDELCETAWLQQQDAAPQAIVAFCDLSACDLQAQLDAQQHYSKVRGVRHIIGRHAQEDAKHGSDALLDDPRFLEGLKTLANRKLTFDLQMIPPQMPRVIKLLRQVPDLPVVLCHAGSPWDQTPAGLAHWRQGLQQLAALPNTYCKVSGLGMFNPHWTQESLRPLILSVIELFGPGRVMFGSNFPVDKLYNSYEALWTAYDRITAPMTAAERQQLFSATAEHFYRL